MATPGAAQKDFFISYNKADKAWAEWIAWQLEAAGYSTIIQAWDMLPGSDFVEEMDKAAALSHRTIAVLSPDYLTSNVTKPEWTAAFRRSRTEGRRVLLPVRVRECELEGLLAGIVYADLVGQGEDEARKRLLAQASGKRGKPNVAPAFPGLMQQVMSPSPAFPGTSQQPIHEVLWMVPHRRNPYFTGREEVLNELAATFTAKSGIVIQALTGLGGIGKTQTALEYACRFEQAYQAVFWVRAETRELLTGDLLTMATRLQLPECQAQEQAVIVAAVTRWLEEYSGWLLVLDNVEDVALAREALPTRGSGHVLLTARAQALGALDRATPLKTLPAEEAARFLLRRANLLAPGASLAAATAEQQARASAIVAALGGLTLALGQAAAYLEETGCGLADYLDLFQTRRTALLGSRGTDAQGHPDPVAVTWSVAFEQVQQASLAAADLLRLCAFLSPEAIPEDLFRDGARELPPGVQEAVNDPLQWNSALAVLRRFSLIERSTDTKTLGVHRLVQAVLQDALPDDERRAWAERTVRLVNAAFPSGAFETWERCQQVLPHALACAAHIEQWQLAFSAAAHLLNQAGVYLNKRAQYAEELPFKQKELAIYEQVLGPTHPNVATSLNNLAWFYQARGQYAEALPLYERALPDHPNTAHCLGNLANLLRRMRQEEQASEYAARAQAIWARRKAAGM